MGSRSLSLMRVSTLRPSTCTSASSEHLSSCFFLHSTFSQERRVVLVPNQWRQGRMMTVLTTSGSPSQPSRPQALARLAPGRGRLSVGLVLTQNNSSNSDKANPANQDSDLQQASTHFDYLKVNGHQIWISDFAFTLDFVTPAFVSRPVKHFKIKFYRDMLAKLSTILPVFQLSV